MGRYRELLEQDGWFVARGVLSADDIAMALDRLRAIARDIRPYEHLPNIHPVSDPRLAAHPDPLYHFEWIDCISFHDDVLWRHVAAHPGLLSIARDVLASDDVFALNGGGMFLKPPGSTAPVPWHQDVSPFSDATDGQPTNPILFDFWLGLTEATPEMGCLRLIPDSRRLGRVPHVKRPDLLHETIDPADFGYGPDDIIEVPTGPGDVIVWHQDAFHGSEPNRADHSRIAVASMYHGRAEEDRLRVQHARGANRVRPQLCAGETILAAPDPIVPVVA